MTDQVERALWRADDKRLQESELAKLLKARGTEIRTCHACGSLYDDKQGCTCEIILDK